MRRNRTRGATVVEKLECRRLLAAHVWSGAVNGNWSNAGNWSSGGVPTSAESNLTIDFPANGTTFTTSDNIASLTITAFTFEGGYSITGNAFTLSGSVSSSGSGSASIGDNVTLGSDATFTAGGSELGLYGNISGSHGVTLTAGLLYLSGANAFTGTTTIQAGTFDVGSIEAFGASTAPVVVDSGGSIQMELGQTIPNPLTIAGAGSGSGALTTQSAFLGATQLTCLWSGAVTLAGATTVAGTDSNPMLATPATTLEFTGAIGGSGNLTAAGGHVLLQESVNNTYSGATTVTDGTLMLHGSGVAVPGNVEIAGGTLDEQVSNQFATSVVLTVDSGGTFQIDTGITQTVGGLGGGGIIDGSGTLTFAASTTDFFTGQINGAASINITSGWLILNGTSSSTTTGTVSMSGGGSRLSLNSSLPDAQLSFTGGELFGNGTIGSVSAAGGVTQPGGSNGSPLSVVGNLSLTGPEYAWVGVSNTNYEVIDVGGTVTLGGSFAIANLALGYTPASGTVFTIINNLGSQPVSGTFAGLPEGHVLSFNGGDWKISYVGGDGNDVTLTYLGLPTTTTLTSTGSPTAFGLATFHATVAPTGGGLAVPTGAVTFLNGSSVIGVANLDNTGTATLQAQTLPVGSYTITATYSGDTAFESSPSSESVSQTVTKAATTTMVGTSVGTTSVGGAVTLTATVGESNSPSEPTGSVTFSVNGTAVGTQSLNNAAQASMTLSNLPAGADHITASYAGDGNYQSSATSTPAGVSVVPTISITNATITESTSGTGEAQFTLLLNAASNEIVTVNYATVDGTALAGRDYSAATGTVTFNPGQTSGTITVPVIGSTDYKPTETFSVQLSGAVSASIPSGTATGTIQNGNDRVPASGLMPDPLNPNETDLVVDGTAGANTIQIKSAKIHGQVTVTVNHQMSGPFSPTGHIVVYGMGANNKLIVDPKISLGVIFFGGNAANTFSGGAGGDIAVGGAGKSTFADNVGRNFLIGGAGPASLKGDRAGNVLIGGTTSYDGGKLSDIYALESLLGEWSAGASYDTRAAAMAGGVGMLNAHFSSTTIPALNSADHLQGTKNVDWLIAAPSKTKHAGTPRLRSRRSGAGHA